MFFASVLTLAVTTPVVRLLPGAPQAPGSWPSFLFLFRGALPDFRHQEVKSSAGTLGVDVSRISFEAASNVGDDTHGLDYDLLQWVQLPDAQTAAAVASRACLVRACFDVWASANYDMCASTHDVDAAAMCADDRWQVLADAVQFGLSKGPLEDPEALETAEAARPLMLSPLSNQPWRCDTFSIGWKKPRDLKAKIALMEKFDALLAPLPGEVSLRDPRHIIALIEDCRGPFDGRGQLSGPSRAGARETMSEGPREATDADALDDGLLYEEECGDTSEDAAVDGGEDSSWLGGLGAVRPPSALFLGRQLAVGASSHLARFALSRRPYLGRTTLPPAYALLMANQARIVEGFLVLDPFCGTGSTLLTCADRGARTVGVEIDERVLLGGDGGRGIRSNFDDASLSPPELLLLGDASRLDAPDLLPQTDPQSGVPSPYARFDAIITDPPYGLMEGLGSFYMPLHERLDALLRLSARRLRLGGRLVFLLPIPSGADALDALHPDGKEPPAERCLELEAVCRQRMSLRMHRLMVTMRKVAEPETEEEGWLPPTWADDAADGTVTGVPTTSRRGHGGDAAGTGAAVAPWEDWWESSRTSNK